MKPARQLHDLIDSFEEHDDDVSGVRRMPLVPLLDPRVDEPAPLHCSVTVEAKGQPASRRYYLGVQFPLGVIEAEGWERPMRADGLSERTIEQLRAWLDVLVM